MDQLESKKAARLPDKEVGTRSARKAAATKRALGKEWCRGAESNRLRRPFQGRALPVSYPGTGWNEDSTRPASQPQPATGARIEAETSAPSGAEAQFSWPF
jgi:hypothetical protein